MAKELWDAYDREGNPLGFDLVRGEPVPAGAWHLVVNVYSVTIDGRVLVTRRHPAKHWGGCWEVTGGSVLKGETPVQGALRELREETGIVVSEAELRPVHVEPQAGADSIYYSFLIFFDPGKQAVRLQDGETVDYRLLPYEEFKRFILTDKFVDVLARRFLEHRDAFDRLILRN